MSNTRLQALFDSLSEISVDPSEYQGVLGDVVFEIVTADTFIAGIAMSLLEGNAQEPHHRSVLLRGFMIGADWRLSDGRQVALKDAPELLEYACLLEALREQCLKHP